MGNNIASMLIESLRNSSNDTTLISKTKNNPPEFVFPEDIPGIAKAWVSFGGYVPINESCPIYNSSNVQTVSCNGVGQYDIVFSPNTFTNGDYIVTGSVTSNSRVNLSGGNTFFIKSSGASPFTDTTAIVPNKDSIRIQTLYVNVVSGNTSTSGPAYANRVNLMFYK